MALDGIAAIQARIQSIEQQVAGVAVARVGRDRGVGHHDRRRLRVAALRRDEHGGRERPRRSQRLRLVRLERGAEHQRSRPLFAPERGGRLTGSNSAGGLGATSSSSAALTSLVSSLTGSGGTSTGSPDLSSLIAALSGSGAVSPTASVTTTPNAVADPDSSNTALEPAGQALRVGRDRVGDRRRTRPSFDCSELTKWAAARSGVTIPDGAAHQYVWLKQQGATMSVQQALQTPGALLFHFDSEPQPGLGGEPPVAHVAISLGQRQDHRGPGPRVRRRRVRRPATASTTRA